MSESIKFRSSVNGFNRNEVISYIENLLKEKEQLLRENELLKAECAARGEEAEAVRKELAEEKKKCDGCDIARKAEAKLGATMLEAKRFSESLVNDAQSRVKSVFDAASLKASSAANTAGQISDKLFEVLKMCTDTVSGVAKNVDGIKEMLASFDASLADLSDVTVNNDNVFEFVEEPKFEASAARAENSVPDTAKTEETETEVLSKNTDTGVSSEIFDSPIGANRFGAVPTAEPTEDVLDGEFETINAVPRVPMFADDGGIDGAADGAEQTETGETNEQGGFTPDFSFEDGFTIKVDLDD